MTKQQLGEYVAQGAGNTAREIFQQPSLWCSLLDSLNQQSEAMTRFLARELNPQTKIVFTGAGSSAFIGQTVAPYLRSYGIGQACCIASTDLVLEPRAYLQAEDQVLLVSCARSGDSPESVAVLDLVEQLAARVSHLGITCNPQGQLARRLAEGEHSFLFCIPQANDLGFAMTGSFTCMLLAALQIFRLDDLPQESPFQRWSEQVDGLMHTQLPQLRALAARGYHRFVALGSGGAGGLAQEAHLKVLELSASHHTALFDTPLGFRHGPKSVLDNRTLVMVFVSADPYTSRYERDLLAELMATEGEHQVVALTPCALPPQLCHQQVVLPDIPGKAYSYLNGLAGLVIAQLYALENAIKLGVRPDNPSPSGSVNRVVQGVTIYPWEAA